MSNRHKHADLIHAWCEGAEIQVKSPENGSWLNVKPPGWDLTLEYRIKPDPKLDWSEHVRVSSRNNQICGLDLCLPQFANLVLTFDGETGNLISAEVLK